MSSLAGKVAVVTGGNSGISLAAQHRQPARRVSNRARLVSLTAHTRWRNQWRSQLIGTGHLDTTWSWIRMIGRQRAAPGKCIGSHSLSRAESDAGRSLSTPIINRITELDSPTRAIGRNMNG